MADYEGFPYLEKMMNLILNAGADSKDVYTYIDAYGKAKAYASLALDEINRMKKKEDK